MLINTEKKKMIKSTIDNLLDNIIEDENDPTRRNFRGWINGGYGESMYHKHMKRIENATTFKKLRSFVIEQFTAFIAREAGCSYGYAQKSIVNYYNSLDDRDGLNRGDSLAGLTYILVEEIDQTFTELHPDSLRAPVTEAGINAID